MTIIRNILRITAIVCALACLMVSVQSCDSHERLDTSIHVSYVLCADHSCLPPAEADSLKKPVVGVVFSMVTDDHPAMAVMLKDFEGVFCDSLMSNGTSTSTTAYDGESNTVSMLSSVDGNTGRYMCPIAQHILSSHPSGQSDYIPSVAEMREIAAVAPVINPIIKKYGGDEILTTGECWYWTSTEVSANSSMQSWLLSAANGGIMATPKTETHKVRAIVQLNYPE